MKRRLIIRRIVVWLLVSIVIFLTGVLAQLYAHDVTVAVLVTVGLGLADALLWPVLTYLALPYTVVTFGLAAFLVNAALFWGVALLFPGIKISGWGLLFLPVSIAAINTMVSGLLTFNNDASFYHVVSRRTRRRAERAAASREIPGFIFLEIDGLSEPVLRKAIGQGKVPALAGLVKGGTHLMTPWETDFSSQSAASQAGILHGNNHNIPAFRWVEKAVQPGKVVSGIGDSSAIERRISNGHGLLAVNGRAAVNIYSGDAKDNIFVYSKIAQTLDLYRQSGAFSGLSYNLIHTLVYMVWEMIREANSRFRQWRRNTRPRLEHRGLRYYFTRAFAACFLRELTTYTVVGDMIAGDKDVVYSSFLGYDEVSHHCGVADEESMFTLEHIDRAIARILKAREYARRRYQVCILSDHGQSNGATFRQRYGYSLAHLVQKLIPSGQNTYYDFDSNQDHFGQVVSTLPKNVRKPLETGKKPLNLPPAKPEGVPDVIVLASGNMGLIYFTAWPERLSIETIERYFPGIVASLSSHEGISFIMVRTNDAGSLVMGAGGKRYLNDNKIVGQDPLSKFGPSTAAHLRRLDGFDCVPDIMLISMYDSEKDEVAAFEELIGSHGGVGGNQSKPFLVYPAEWHMEEGGLSGAESVGRWFRLQIEQTRRRREKQAAVG